MTNDFSSITEVPGSRATREQRARLYQRYHLAQQYASGKRVLEVACGAGMGLGYIGRIAKYLVGGDYTERLLHIARSHYADTVPLIQLDGHDLPFMDRVFDLIVFFEAIYYLSRPDLFVAESRRVLEETGVLLISTVNREWSEFTPSLLSANYPSKTELRHLLIEGGFKKVDFFGAFPTAPDTSIQKAVSIIRRVAVACHLVPKTLGGREVLKRLFYGSLTPLQPEVSDNMADLFPIQSLQGSGPERDFKIIYAVARVG